MLIHKILIFKVDYFNPHFYLMPIRNNLKITHLTSGEASSSQTLEFIKVIWDICWKHTLKLLCQTLWLSRFIGTGQASMLSTSMLRNSETDHLHTTPWETLALLEHQILTIPHKLCMGFQEITIQALCMDLNSHMVFTLEI